MELKNVKNPWKACCVGISIFSGGSVCIIYKNSHKLNFAVRIASVVSLDHSSIQYLVCL